jgi:hypothetical protein
MELIAIVEHNEVEHKSVWCMALRVMKLERIERV